MTAVSAASGDAIYVNSSGGNDSWDGLSAAHTDGTLIGPKLSIKNATGTVNTNGTIHIANGQYTGENNTNITIDKNMGIIGESQTGTIINGTGTNWIFNVSSGVTVTIKNLTLTNGNSTTGGAIENYGNLTVNNCIFTDNTANYGGAIYNEGDTCNVTGSTFTGNNARDGGAICGSNCDVTGSTFTGNNARNGGAIYNWDTCDVTGSTFTSNTVVWEGGAIYNDLGTINMSDCTFTDNNATDGGAIYNWHGTINMSDCTFTDNNATRYGGAICNRDALTAHYNRFYNNTAPNGNAISCYGGSVYADYNWWGSNLDPKTISNLLTVNGGSVDVTYWVILSVNATPNNINNTKTSIITADFNHINGGGDLIGGHIPDGPITLDIPWGSFTSSGITHSITKNTVDGVMTALFYATEGAIPAVNPVKATAAADGYTTNNTESAYITINKTSDLYIKTISSNNKPKVGQTFILTYKLGNNGPDTAENVTITFQIPEGLYFVNISVDNGKWHYNETTRTVTWTLDSVPVGDPYLNLTVKAADDGTYKITPAITSNTYNLNSGDDGIITINVQPNSNSGNGTSTNTVNAASKTTIGLQETGLPLNYLILAVLMVLSGLVPKRK